MESKGDDFLAEQREFFRDARLEMVTEADNDQRGAGLHAAGAKQSATCGDGSSIAGSRVKSLIEHPAGESLDDGTGATEIDFAVWQRQVKAPDEFGFLLECLTQSAWCFLF